MNNKPKTSPKDFFLHLLSMVALYASAISFTVIAFQSINLWVPDALEFMSKDGARSLIRGGLSFLIVMFPVYVVTLIALFRSYQKDKAKRDLWVRKWLLYFTLFVAALIIIITLVVLMNTFLDGELTLRFILKLIAVIFVAGSIFTYYFWDLKDKKGETVKYFSYSIIALVIVSVVIGFINAGLPGEERQRRLDDRIVSNFQSIQWNVLEMYKTDEALPESLAEIKKEFGGDFYDDPRTGEELVYNKTGELTFKLCANFVAEDSGDEKNGRFVSPRFSGDILTEASSWEHSVGNNCFQRTIDKEKYEKQKNDDGNPVAKPVQPPIAY